MTQRYYVPQLPPDGGELDLPETEAHHARTVMRARTGDQIELFDGEGGSAKATIQQIIKRQIICQTEPLLQSSDGIPVPVVMGVAFPKGDRSKLLIEKLTELGVQECVPLSCERTQFAPSAGAIEKWRSAMLAACKQSGRNRLMEIDSGHSVINWFQEQPTADTNWLNFIAHPETAEKGNPSPPFQQLLAEQILAAKSQDSAVEPTGIRIAIGPEGGFSPDEVEAAEAAGWQTVSLGQLVYRIETAAIVLAALAIHR
ncbi:Ribosomal RNA small subunit methyltransferase E [Roseimaritima multifibrata]|uniref:Ribosomal RNA small subunit methyltransferase E n=1 Tax=Roseimaritima multifibrata TaxID=1930274 RepID=A0A517MBS7_9BACT|nr:RsmE family RNA methyltransferase [Roseimaritima multifibrata]QDS92315.1 Ribosomal RNA small subunit methyltransferase E [Roseimaritima multifibrata]